MENEFMRPIVSAILMLGLFPATATFAQTPAPTSDPALTVSAARALLVGRWEGSLEYLDYSANEWFGIPVKTVVEDQGDGATLIRKSDFDDGPTIGNVRITTVELFDAAKGTLTVGSFRKGRESEIMHYAVRFEGVPKDASHWTMIEETDAKDDNRPARLRLTTVRDGDSMQTLKQVDFQDDKKDEWLSRNRTTLRAVPAGM
jgi:hypothetical protein